jgi:hypothetical protein
MKVEWVAYTRKNFNFPEVQKFPHRDPQEEVSEVTVTESDVYRSKQ